MLTLFSYPGLFGVADNNGYGLKVYAFMRLTGLPFHHAHVFDASRAPRSQLPYIDDDGLIIGDSSEILDYLAHKYQITIDAELSNSQRNLDLLISRLLDDLYWVMSYSRWKDERYWPAFRDALMREHPQLNESTLQDAKAYNAQRYHWQGIGRYSPDEAMTRGITNLKVLADRVPIDGFVHGAQPTSIDAGIYGFIANILFYDIPTPLKQCVEAHPQLVRHCRAIHARIGS